MKGQPAMLCGKPPKGRNLALRIIDRFPEATVGSTRRAPLGSPERRRAIEAELARPAADQMEREQRRGRA